MFFMNVCIDRYIPLIHYLVHLHTHLHVGFLWPQMFWSYAVDFLGGVLHAMGKNYSLQFSVKLYTIVYPDKFPCFNDILQAHWTQTLLQWCLTQWLYHSS